MIHFAVNNSACGDDNCCGPNFDFIACGIEIDGAESTKIAAEVTCPVCKTEMANTPRWMEE